MIGQKINKPLGNYADYSAAAAWANENGAMIEDKGNYYEVVPVPPPAPPTPEEIQKQLTQVVQNMLDNKAREKNYDGILSACSYANSTNPKFAAEAAACIDWRDAVWAAGYALLEQALAGEIPIPSPEELILMLPVMEWPQ